MWFYQYGDDRTDDRGWGCVWRNLQTLLHHLGSSVPPPPIAALMSSMGVPRSGRARDMWIEPQQCKEYLWEKHRIRARLVGLRVQPGRLLRTAADDFDATTDDPRVMDRWIRTSALPCVIVDDAVTSYCIMGLDSDGDYIIGDPHGTDRRLRRFRGRAWLERQPMLMALV
jgi:hypothetical protein